MSHFDKEIVGLSMLFQYLLKDDFNQKYVFFAVKRSLEVMFYLEFVLRLAKEDSNKVLSLLSKDMAQIGAAIDVAISPTEKHSMHKILKAVVCQGQSLIHNLTQCNSIKNGTLD